SRRSDAWSRKRSPTCVTRARSSRRCAPSPSRRATVPCWLSTGIRSRTRSSGTPSRDSSSPRASWPRPRSSARRSTIASGRSWSAGNASCCPRRRCRPSTSRSRTSPRSRASRCRPTSTGCGRARTSRSPARRPFPCREVSRPTGCRSGCKSSAGTRMTGVCCSWLTHSSRRRASDAAARRWPHEPRGRGGRAGGKSQGWLRPAGAVRDLLGVVKDIPADVLSPASLKRLRGLKVERLPLVRGRPRLGCPLAGIGKMVCIGLNYSDHAREVGLPAPAEPTLFIKATSAINGPYDPIVRPPGAVKLDYEVELAAVIGRDARHGSEDDALKHVVGYTIVDDVSERAFQMERGGTTTKGKSADTFAPIGPWLVTADEVGDPQTLEVWTTVN